MLKQYVVSEATRRYLTALSDSYERYPAEHIAYLHFLKNEGVNPPVIYDIGSAALHWTRNARKVWPDSQYYLFDATRAVEFLYTGENYHIGVLSNDERMVDFYENPISIGGNSLYRENKQYCATADLVYTPECTHKRKTSRLDKVVAERGFPPPNFIKIDVQGAELEILQGAGDLLNTVEHIILELPKVEYNLGAPHPTKLLEFLDEKGFEMFTPYFYENVIDGDCHLIRKQI